MIVRTHVRAGFSLIEIMIALTIIGLLAAVAGPMFMRYLEKGRLSTTKQNLLVLKRAVEEFNGDTGQYPETLKDLVKKPSNPDLAKEWSHPYIDKKEVPKDGWGHPFIYKVTPGTEHDYELYSHGPKGKSGPKGSQINAWDL